MDFYGTAIASDAYLPDMQGKWITAGWPDPQKNVLRGMKETSSTFPGSEPEVYFASFRLKADGTLRRGNAVIDLPPKELAALRLLLAHAGQLVTFQQLSKELWGNVHVTADRVPKCISSLRKRLEPEQCIQIVDKCGYCFSAEVRQPGTAPAIALPRLAIMPFATGYTVPEYLGSAIAEGTMARLASAQYPRVSLLAQDSVFTLARCGQTAQQIGETLKADLVLTGMLRAFPSHFRLRAEMIQIKDGSQIWVEDLYVPESRTAGLESELAQRLAFRMGCGSLYLASETTSNDGREDWILSHKAYEIFQQAHDEWQTLRPHRMQDAQQHLVRAIELDPSLTAARMDFVNLSLTQAFYGFLAPTVAADHVRHATEPGFPTTAFRREDEGLISDPAFGTETFLPALGWISFHVDHNLTAAIEAFSLSEHLPYDPWAIRLRVMFALSRHHFSEAIELLDAALKLDPYSPWLHARKAWALHLAGQATESVDQVRYGLTFFPNHAFIVLYGAIILAFNGDAAHAIQLTEGILQRSPYFDPGTAILAYALACADRSDEARTLLEQLQQLSRKRFVLSSFTPAAWATLGDTETAIAELRNAAEARCPWFFQMLADPRLAPLHGHPEFEEMLSILPRMEEAAEPDPPPQVLAKQLLVKR